MRKERRTRTVRRRSPVKAAMLLTLMRTARRSRDERESVKWICQSDECGVKDSPAVTSDETPLWASCDLISLLKSVPAIEMPTTPPTNCAKVTSAVAWGMSLGRLWNAAEEEERNKGSVLPKQPQKKSKRGSNGP